MSDTIILALFGILFSGLLGVYALGFKLMKDMNVKVDKHVQDTTIHVDPEHPLMTSAVCAQIQEKNELHFDTLADGQNRIEKQLGILVEKLIP